MFELKVVQAEFGDCLILLFGSSANPRYILIDGGPENIYSFHLKGELKKIHDTGGKLELVVLSHVDTDHITGLLDLFAELRQQKDNGQPLTVKVDALWHNSFTQTIGEGNNVETRLKDMCAKAKAANQVMAASGMDILGIADGHALRTAALAFGLPLNPGFNNGLVSLDTSPSAITMGNLDLTVLGPTRTNLDNLKQEWLAWLDAHEDEVGGADPFVAAMADRSKPNLSSIMLLAKAEGKSLLLTGDGRGDHLLQGLQQANLLDVNGRIHVDMLKLFHHGSDRNVTKKFFKTVTAHEYVASANGKDGNPDLATLIWLVEAAKEQQRNIIIHVTNQTPSTQKLEDEYDPQEYGYTLHVMKKGDHSMTLPLA